MEVNIVVLRPITIIGMRVMTQMANLEATLTLWREFSPRRDEIPHQENGNAFSITRYLGFGPQKDSTLVERWAAVQVRHFNTIPDGMTALDLPGGTYAQFHHRGTASTLSSTINQFHKDWLPDSGFTVDDRPHMEIIPEDYPGPDSPVAQEEVFIPIK